MLRLLYVGNTSVGWNGDDRAAAFRTLGFRVIEFDRTPFLFVNTRAERSIAARYCIGRAVRDFNQSLLKACEGFDFDAVFIDKGNWLYHSSLLSLKSQAALKLAVHYTPDAQFFENRSRHFFRAVPDYDLLVTTKEFEIDHYRRAGARELLFILQGYGRRLEPVPMAEIPAELHSEVCFVGHCQPAYERFLSVLAAGVPLAIWGPNWPRAAKPARLGAGLRPWRGALWSRLYARLVRGKDSDRAFEQAHS